MSNKNTGSTPVMIGVVAFIFIFFALILTSGGSKETSVLEYNHHTIVVNKVIDGDTLDVRDKGVSFKVRLYGIDAPEITQEDGVVCREHLKQLLENKEITLRRIGSDRYNRIICIVYSNGDCVNERTLS